MRVSKLDTLLAFKAIGLAEGLKESDRRVACALLDHFNRDTWRCDPSLDTIASLLGISRRTVIRSVAALVQHGYFRKLRHGGQFHRNSYEPVWDKFRTFEAHWKALRERHRARFAAPNLSPSEGPTCHAAGDDGGTQTCSSNLLNETSQEGSARTRSHPDRSPERHPQSATKDTDRQIRPSEAARSAAQWRWDKDLLDRCMGRADLYARIVEVIDQAIADGATEAELKHRGSGLEHILEELERLGLSSLASAIRNAGDGS